MDVDCDVDCDDVGRIVVSLDVIIGVVPVQFPYFRINFSSVFSASSIFKSRDVSTVRRRPIIVIEELSGV